MRQSLTADPILPHTAPLDGDAFATLMQPFVANGKPSSIALAVSGGPDSMALAVCMHRWAKDADVKITAFIVDHALRDTSANEAVTTQKTLTSLGIDVKILRWEHDAVVARLHVTARKARYALLLDACNVHDIRHLMFAHQQEDQAETILMRLAKGSGVDGLAGIPAQSMMQNVHIWRPFLNTPKAQLIATCVAANVPFVTDPSNASDKFARGRLRSVMPLLANEGLTIERLLDLGTRATLVRDALDHYTNTYLANATSMDDAGSLHFEIEPFRALPTEIAERTIIEALQTINHQDYAPEHASLADLCDALRAETVMPARTLHGCIITKGEKRISLMREFSAITSLPISPGQTVIWDGRWQVTLSAEAEDKPYIVKPLGSPAHDELDRLAPGLRHKIPQGRARACLPALWLDNILIAASVFDNSNQTTPLRAMLRTVWTHR